MGQCVGTKKNERAHTHTHGRQKALFPLSPTFFCFSQVHGRPVDLHYRTLTNYRDSLSHNNDLFSTTGTRSRVMSLAGNVQTDDQPYQQWVEISFHSWLHHGWCLVALSHTFVQPYFCPSEQRINVAINRLQDQRSHADRKRESS